MKLIKKHLGGLLLTSIVSLVALYTSSLIPNQLVSGGIFALLAGMLLNPQISKHEFFQPGIKLVAKQVLQLGIILMGLTLSFSQVFTAGKYSLVVTFFTLLAAFGGGYILGKILDLDWKLTSLLTVGTGICGGSAIAALAPVIKAKDKDIAYALSSTFIFGMPLIILLPLAGKYVAMTDQGFGLWVGTAVNDVSSVVATGYAFSDAAGDFSVIVKLTRTLFIIPIVMIFSIINNRISNKANYCQQQNICLVKLFPTFILFFLLMVALKSADILQPALVSAAAYTSKFFMTMALGAIGLKTNFKEISSSGLKPMLLAFIVTLLVIGVSFITQSFMQQL